MYDECAKLCNYFMKQNTSQLISMLFILLPSLVSAAEANPIIVGFSILLGPVLIVVGFITLVMYAIGKRINKSKDE